ncbi:hypothetical protein Aeh1ORF057c [Aeromonas phage Aeh1]|uniref:Uncharacterized protein n=1 Tax=Aeromonas phage Aeh1 TaxID=2880362 RepID=Q76Z29_9CAUD|nr:hypothetical protein Aeh1p062 [Aeromonas phage Aeh1]AAQ17717.1 hypothetical protein Aeh1ORF057c [Aeromonas phage Aeh1]
MFIKKEDMKASMAVYQQMIANGHIEGVKIKEIFTIPAMIKKTVQVFAVQVVYGVPMYVPINRESEIKVPNVHCKRELVGYDVTVIAKSPVLFEGIVARPEFRYTFNKQKHYEFMKKCLH